MEAQPSSRQFPGKSLSQGDIHRSDFPPLAAAFTRTFPLTFDSEGDSGVFIHAFRERRFYYWHYYCGGDFVQEPPCKGYKRKAPLRRESFVICEWFSCEVLHYRDPPLNRVRSQRQTSSNLVREVQSLVAKIGFPSGVFTDLIIGRMIGN